MKYHNGPTQEPIFYAHDRGFTDTLRREFLDAIDPDLVRITQWEKDFINFTKRQTRFTPRQRASIARMIQAYGSKVNWSRKSEYKSRDDALLEAAAPALLFACKHALGVFKEKGLLGIEILESAIRQAEGKK